MSARGDYELRVSRSGRAPAWLAGGERTDIVEVVEIASGEVVLLWDCAARDANRMAHAIRADLDRLDAAEFLERWNAVEGPDSID